MLRQLVFHDFSNRPSKSRLITISAFAAACVAMFVIPWIFPRTQPVVGESYALGFNNRLAVIGLCLVIVAAALARLFSASAADDARETLAWFAGDGWQAIRRTTKLELAILGLFCFFMTQFILWWDGMLVIPYWGGSGLLPFSDRPRSPGSPTICGLSSQLRSVDALRAVVA
jgi:hypothetical protein